MLDQLLDQPESTAGQSFAIAAVASRLRRVVVWKMFDVDGF